MQDPASCWLQKMPMQIDRVDLFCPQQPGNEGQQGNPACSNFDDGCAVDSDARSFSYIKYVEDLISLLLESCG